MAHYPPKPKTRDIPLRSVPSVMQGWANEMARPNLIIVVTFDDGTQFVDEIVPSEKIGATWKDEHGEIDHCMIDSAKYVDSAYSNKPLTGKQMAIAVYVWIASLDDEYGICPVKVEYGPDDDSPLRLLNLKSIR